jgi:hypothetical protein
LQFSSQGACKARPRAVTVSAAIFAKLGRYARFWFGLRRLRTTTPASIATERWRDGAQGDTKPKRGMFCALSIYLVASFIWRAVTTAHEFPSTNLRNLTIGLDLFCVIGLIFGGIQIFRDHESDWFGGKVLFWIALIAGLGLFLIRLNGTASWWTGHLNYELSPRP